MREDEIPYTAVSTPSGMLREWLVMPQGLQNAPATFNRCISHLFRPVRSFAPTYFDDIFIHSKAMDGKSALEMHRIHLKKVLQIMKDNELYANLRKCMFGVPEIPVLGCYVSSKGVRADPEKITAISTWPTPRCQRDLRRFLGVANYLHKYSKNYADIVHSLTSLLKKDTVWEWFPIHQTSFDQI